MSSTCFSRLVPLGLCFLVLFHGSLAQQQPQQLKCEIHKIITREPNRSVKSEAGVSEFWDAFENDELQCAGVEAVRHTIYPKGLLLPYYATAPELVYVVRGRGIQGTVLPGCPETFETTIMSEGGREEFSDKHQRIYRYNEGDILALPAGAVHWTHNDGDTPIVTIVLRDTRNVANQLDRKFRKFFLAGNPQIVRPGQQGGRSDEPRYKQWASQRPGQQGQGPWELFWEPSFKWPWGISPWGRPGQQGESTWERPGQHGEHSWERPGQQGEHFGQQEHDQEGSNIFSGFDDMILQEVFNVGHNTVRQLKGGNDNRGIIVLAENLQVVVPEEQEHSSPRGRGRDNGVEETMCSIQLRANIASPARADVYNPRGGRISTLNSHKLPVLDLLQLSAERGVLYKNAILAPHYNLNAHSIIYVTSGSSRLQIVKNDGSSVFNDVVKEGQLIVVPQDFAVIKKAGEQGCEWVAFKTNDNAITTQLAGRFSYIRALPKEVLANSYDISQEDAQILKYNRREGVLLSPRSGSNAKNALLNAIFG